MSLRAALITGLLAMTALQGSLALTDEPPGPEPSLLDALESLDLQENDPTGPVPMQGRHVHDDAHHKRSALGGPTPSDLACDPQEKTCTPDAPDGPLLPGFGTAMASDEVCSTLRQWLEPAVYEPVAEILCDEGKEPGPDPGPLPDPPLPLPEFFLDPEAEHSLGFDGADLHLSARLEFSYLGLNFTSETEADASLRMGDEDVPPPQPGQVPCSDPRGCPDLVVDDSRLLVGDIVERSFTTDDCAVEEESAEPGDRRLLRFTFTTPNLGRGDLIIGDPEDNPQWFEWGDCHEHWHFESFADYRLWTMQGYTEWQNAREENPDATAQEVLDDHPHLEDELVSGHKQGFCLIDVRVYVPFTGANYRSCSSDQGISVGWADEYHHELDGQWVDITDVDAGIYVLEAEVNPERLFQESDYTNNAGAVFVAIPPQVSLPPVEPPIEPPGGLPEEELECDDCLPVLSVDKERLLRNLRYSTETFSPDDCNVAEGSTQPGTRDLIRFATKIPNLGNATLSIGDPEDHPDLFEWGDCHGHWHYLDFVDHRLWNRTAYREWREARDAQPERPAQQILDENPHLRDGLVKSDKQGFCLIDIERAHIVYPQTPRRHTSCTNQGISAGWADVYGSQLDGQFIDVTGVPPGVYVLELEVNPGRTVQEGNYDDNAVAVLVPIA